MDDHSEFQNTVARLIQDAQVSDTSDITRSKLFDRYMGEPYGDEQPNRSKFISTDVADAVEALLPDIMDVFTSSESLLEFTPTGPEDEEAAKQETDAVSHIFWKENDGFLVLYTWFKEALIQQNAYVKSGWVEKERVTIEEYESLSPEEFVSLLDQLAGDGGEYEFLELDGVREVQGQFMPAPDETGAIQPINLKVRCVKVDKKYEIEAIPQEEFFLTPRWHKLSLDGIPCCGHRREIEVGELRAMGFSEDSIQRATDEGPYETEQTESRFDTQDHFYDAAGNDGDDATRRVTVYEAYVRADHNDDGKAELLKVWTVGDGSTFLQWENGEDAVEEVSHVPFSALTPYIVPHRHVGRSVAELVDDIQQVKTVLLRHTLDNLYFTNYSRPHFDENRAGPHTYKDLLSPAPGAPVRTGEAEIVYQAPQPVFQTTLPLLEVFDSLKETRTGATRYNQGLDAETLNKTATGIQKIMNASQKKTMLIARTFAETGLKDLFLRIHRDLRAGPMKQLVLKLRGKWEPVNPRTWKDRTDLTVQVGMGSGDREMVRAGLTLFGQIQEKLAAAGSRLVDEQKLYNTAERMGETFGFEDITAFLNNPAEMGPAQPKQPGPQEQLAMAQVQQVQSQAQANMLEIQRRAAEMREQFAIEREKMQLEHQREMEKIRLQASAEERQQSKAAAEIYEKQSRMEMDRDKAVMDDDFKRDKLLADTAMKSEPPIPYNR